MAGAGFKNWNNGDVLYSSDLNTYLGQQTVMVFANATARTAALSGYLAEGMVSYLKDTDTVEVYDGTNWVGFTGDITALSAGTGISLTSATGPIPTVAIDTAVVPRLANANTFTATNTFNAAGTTAVDLIIKANASQTANLFEIQNSSGSAIVRVNSSFNLVTDGALYVSGGAGVPVYTATVQVSSPAFLGLIVRGAASQTADLQQWQNSAGTVLSYVRSDGFLFTPGLRDVAGTGAFLNTGATTAIQINTRTLSNVGLIVQGVASQSADLQQWQNSAGTVLAKVDSGGAVTLNTSSTDTSPFGVAGQIRLNNTNNTNSNYTIIENYANGAITSGITFQNTNWTSNYGRIVIGTRSAAGFNTNSFIVPSGGGFFTSTNTAANVVATVRGAASQTANLQEWQNSAGTVLTSVGADGTFTRGATVIDQYGSIYTTEQVRINVSAGIASSLSVVSRNNTQPTIVIKGVGSQTVNLQEWQNSAGTVLANVSSSGNITGAGFLTGTSYVVIGEQNSGGSLRMTKQTAAGTNPGADIARLYFRDGTTAGTLKLVVRAGAAGAETTILDNIPQ